MTLSIHLILITLVITDRFGIFEMQSEYLNGVSNSFSTAFVSASTTRYLNLKLEIQRGIQKGDLGVKFQNNLDTCFLILFKTITQVRGSISYTLYNKVYYYLGKNFPFFLPFQKYRKYHEFVRLLRWFFPGSNFAPRVQNTSVSFLRPSKGFVYLQCGSLPKKEK